MLILNAKLESVAVFMYLRYAIKSDEKLSTISIWNYVKLQTTGNTLDPQYSADCSV